MTKPVRIKQCKYFQDIIKQNQLPYLLNSEKEVFDRVYVSIRDNELYNRVWWAIEAEGKRLIDEEVTPVTDELLVKMDEVRKEKVELETKEEKTEEDNAKIEELETVMASLVEEYQDTYTKANNKLNEFKNNYIDNNYKDATCFLLTDEDYDLINKVTGRSIYDGQTEWNEVVIPAEQEPTEE